MVMHQGSVNVLLVSMPFAGINIPSIQLPLLAGYLQRNHIAADESHLYLQAADFYGLSHYVGLIVPPNDSYTAQIVFTKYVFPQHWEKSKKKIQAFYEKKNKHLQKSTVCLSFDEYVSRTDEFYAWMQKNINWKDYDIIGFTLNYGQLLPSLAIAKFIKENSSDTRIVFGGSRTIGELGQNVLRTFNYVDFIVSGEGEEALYQLASNLEQYQHIPNLIFRNCDDIQWNKSHQSIDINSLPLPCYDQFYSQLQTSSSEAQQYYQYHGRLPVEISRGCWWNKCSFCNLNIQYDSYHEKAVKRIVEEITLLTDRYKTLAFELIGNTLPQKQYRTLCTALKELGKDVSLFVEARAGQMGRDDYTLLKETGFSTMQTGIESFSSHYLMTMDKGTRVIDNIAALKFCKESNIFNCYNLIVRYPNEESVDFEQTKHTVQLIQSYLDPPNLCNLRVLYGSPVYCHPDLFNIKSFEPASIDKLLFPLDVLEKNISFVYDFVPYKQPPRHNWEELVKRWKDVREQMMLEAVHQPTPLNKFVFYFIDGGTFVKIYDKRNSDNVQIFTLDTDERMVFLACLDVISFEQLQCIFPEMPEYQLAAILHSFENNGIIFRENDFYLSLPLSISPKVSRCYNVELKSIKTFEKQLPT
jgi:ribosomal peptide maturation radical SAM protein 1